jgi:endonuclease/exonuclease/phosphatase family metal-dependent hydrolase
VTHARPTLRIAHLQHPSLPRPRRPHAPERIAAVLRDDRRRRRGAAGSRRRRPRGGGHAEELGALLGMGWVMAPARQLRGTHFGNAVLSRCRSRSISSTICRGRRASRGGCSASTSRADGCTLHVYNVHLGTALLERRHQAERLATIVSDRHVPGPKIVLGDFNEWMRGLTTTLLSAKAEQRRLAESPAAPAHLPRPFPDPAPRSHLLRRQGGDRRIELPRTRLSLVASDHLPLVADRIG